MGYRTWLLETTGYVGILTLNRPEVLNALNRAMVDELDRIITDIASNPDIRAVILQGSNGHFAAGADISDMVEFTPDQARNFAFVDTFNRLENLPQPTIAAVTGYALGAGLELALACDLIIAGSSAQFGLPEITLGIMPGAGGSQRLPRLIGQARAKELIYVGQRVDAVTAARYGLVNRVVADDVLLKEALQVAQKIASRPPLAIKMAKKVINTGVHMDINSAVQLEKIGWADLFSTADQKEGMRAFMEKRKPEFKGE